MLNIQHGSTHVLFGDDLGDVERFISSTPEIWSPRVRQSRADDYNHGIQWDSGVGHGGALKLMREGWSEGAARLNHGLSALPPPVTRHAKMRMDVAGHYPDVARYLSGDPAHMARKGKDMAHAPVTHILVNGFMISTVRAVECENFGLALAACIDRMEASGRRVGLDIAFVGGRMGAGNRRYVIGWKVKPPGEALDAGVLAFSLGHPAAFRRVGFAMIERTNASGESSSYGFPEKMTAADKALLGDDEAFFTNGISAAHGACATPASALRYAAQQINLAAGETLVELEN